MIDAARAAAARVLALEHPEHFGRVMDLPAHMEAGRAAELILRELQRDSVDEVVGYRGEQRLVPRLRPVVVDTAGDVAGVMRRDRSYLITGGFGALGMQVATALAKAGAGRLLLIGRRGPDAAAMAELVQALASYGTTVVPIRADVTDERAMREAIATHDDPAQPLAGVFHAAGVGGVRPLRDLVEEDVRAVLHPKLRGAWVLHEVTQHRALDHFVLFSSIAGVWGSRGQFHYAAANASLDALAEYRRARGLPGLAISWGPWEGKGMTSPDAAALLLRLGVQALPGDAATSWLLHALSAPHAHLIAAAMDWPRFRGSYEARGPKGLFSELPGATLPAPVGRDDTASRWVESITHALPTQRTRLVRDAMIEAVREVLGWGPTTVVPVDQGLFELGVDSLAALDLRTHLEHLLGTALPATLVFEYPTIDALTQFVEGVLTATPGLPPDTPMAAPLTSLPLTALVDTLTDDEADMLLRQTLETLNLPT
jgi:nucleoside-diphosphate-sugar epimerase